MSENSVINTSDLQKLVATMVAQSVATEIQNAIPDIIKTYQEQQGQQAACANNPQQLPAVVIRQEPSALEVLTSPSQWPTSAKVAAGVVGAAAVGAAGYFLWKKFADD